MTTQFFERQEAQKAYTRWLVWGFVAAIVAVVIIIDLIVLAGLGGNPLQMMARDPGMVIVTSVVVLGVILGGCWHKASEIRSGGAAVARSLGGVPVTAQEGDPQRKRLLNVVEEMAIAARIRKPQVFVLPDEQGINAFAAGHDADEAAVAVTQGALDKLDRDQLQAVIGHEFSHILNGDMRINMRLAAWVFGLYLITHLATRVLRSRGRGKAAARLKIIAFGIFLAGSVGMLAGRLLQAAISRRREHLADASAVQFTRNPQALQGAFVIMAANVEGTRLEHESSAGVAHMFFAGSEPAWANRFGGSLFATHPGIEERVRALDSRVTPSRFKSLVSEQRRKLAARAKAEAADAGAATAPADVAGTLPPGVSAAAPLASAGESASTLAADHSQPGTATGLSLAATFETPALAQSLPAGVRMIAGRALPPDPLRSRLSGEQQSAVADFIAAVEQDSVAVQGTYIAAMLATHSSKWRPQLTKLAPLLGIELLKATQLQISRLAALTPAARLPLLTDLLGLLDGMDPAHRKRLRGVARAFAPTVVIGDQFRFAVTRMLDLKLAKASPQAPPVPLPERATQVGELYASLAHCRFGTGNRGVNAYRAGLMGMLPPQKWLPFPEAPLKPATLDAAVAGVRQIHPTGKRSFSEGMARVIAVGGQLTVTQVDLLRAICQLVDCPTPFIPVDVVYEEAAAGLRAPAANSSYAMAR